MSAVGIMNHKFLIACGADPIGVAAQEAVKNLQEAVKNLQGAVKNLQGAAENLLYKVILTPPAASAGRASIDDFGLGGAGGAIVIGT